MAKRPPPPAGPNVAGVGDAASTAFEWDRPSPRRRGPKKWLSKEQEEERAAAMARRLAWAADKSGVSEREMAAVAMVSADALRNIGRGQARNPGFFTVTLIAHRLGVSPFWLALLTDDPHEFDPPERREK